MTDPRPLTIPKDLDVHRLQAGVARTRLDKRAIRTAWGDALAQALIPPGALAAAVASASTAALIAAIAVSLIAIALLPAQARGCRRLATRRIVRADLYTVSGILPYPEYRRWLASLPDPGAVWRALGAPTPPQRLKILHEFHARTSTPALRPRHPVAHCPPPPSRLSAAPPHPGRAACRWHCRPPGLVAARRRLLATATLFGKEKPR